MPECQKDKKDGTVAEDQKDRGYYYDDAHGYEEYDPEEEDEGEGEKEGEGEGETRGTGSPRLHFTASRISPLLSPSPSLPRSRDLSVER